MLACSRIGATHSIIFGGFSADAVADRNNDAKARLVITADGGWRRGKVVPLKHNVDAALARSPTVEKCIVYNRCNQTVEMKPGRDLWWHELMADASSACPAEPLDSEHPLYILYTSGSTGKPKGVLHTTAGYLLGVSLTHQGVFDLRDDDTYWCTADIKWGDKWPNQHCLSSLRLLGTVAAPINPEAWVWYHKVIGRERCPIVDPWW